MSLRSDLIRLATDQPALRRHLVPVLRKHALDMGVVPPGHALPPLIDPPPFPHLETVEDYMLEPTVKERLKQLSEGAQKFIMDAPENVRKFILSSGHRAKILEQALNKMSTKQMLAELQHQLHRKGKQFVHAEEWLEAIVKGQHPTDKQKEAVEDIGLDLALMLANAFFIHGVFATKVVSSVAKQYMFGVSTEIATRVVSETTDDLSILKDFVDTGSLGYKAIMAYIQKFPQLKKWINLGLRLIRQKLKLGSETEAVKHDLTAAEALQLITFAAVADKIENLDHDIALQAVENVVGG